MIRESRGMAISEVTAITMPGKLLVGASLRSSAASESYAMYAESIRKHAPTIRRVSFLRPFAPQGVRILVETPQQCGPADDLD